MDSTQSNEPSRNTGRWQIILLVLAVLVLLAGLIAPAFQSVRESGPHPIRHRGNSPADLNAAEPDADHT